ncbi:MAG: aminotransferase, partial [Terrimesophilobacter sp.]
RNFLIDAPEGKFLLKVLGAGTSESDLLIQDDALTQLALAGIAAPRPRVGANGSTIQHATMGGSQVRVRLLDFLDGSSLADSTYLAPSVISALGSLSAGVALGLRAVEAPAPDRGLQWDLRRAGDVIVALLGSVRESRREAVDLASRDARARLEPLIGALRTQLIHGDVTDDNVVCRDDEYGRAVPYGVIDFGDLAEGWLVAELAVTVSSLLNRTRSSLASALPAIRAFHEVLPLRDDEVRALWPLVVLRGAVLVVSGEHQVSLEEGNDYASERVEGEWRIFQSATSVNPVVAETMIRDALGMSPLIDPPHDAQLLTAPTAEYPLVAGLGTPQCEILDFSTTSPLLDDGAWLQVDAEWALAREALASHRVALAPYGIPRLTRATVLSDTEPATWPTVTDLYLPADSLVSAPFDAKITSTGPNSITVSATREGDTRVLHIEGIASALRGIVAAGDTMGVALDQHEGIARLRVQNRSASDVAAAPFVVPSDSAVWRALVPNPEPLLGLVPREPVPDAQDEQRRRLAFFPAAQERYYENPPLFERGWREHLIDMRGRVYLDMVNNVAGVGHSDPRLTDAISTQLRLLNTNSRFLYRGLSDLCERLVQHAPSPELDTVLLVNSGTEAVDLAIRLAQLYTGRRLVVSLREAYHGWSMAADAVTTSAYDNPVALASRPDWVHVVESPNVYRGSHREANAGEDYAREFDNEMDALASTGEAIGAFLCEPILGNAGGVLLPEGYLRRVYDSVRARGGVCIADEVQVGYGRLGDYFWGVEQQGVVPDIITIAKAMGNGYPLGAVITRRDIAAALQNEGHFFSSAGGSPVSCAAGIAVLDIMEQDGLQENARVVGGHLATRLRELAGRHPLIGTVHGLGLYLGVELVRDQETREPADTETAAICERLLELGVIMQPTSERQNVLKIKPPLCLTTADADFFVDCLDEVLRDGW